MAEWIPLAFVFLGSSVTSKNKGTSLGTLSQTPDVANFTLQRVVSTVRHRWTLSAKNQRPSSVEQS